MCWGDVTLDLQCQALNAIADIDQVSVARWQRSPEEVAELFSSTELDTHEVDYYSYRTNHTDTCVHLSKMELWGAQIGVSNFFVSTGGYTYVLFAGTGSMPGVGTKALAFVKPAPSGSPTVRIPSGCELLTFAIDLSDTAVPVPRDGPWVLDWRSVSVNGQKAALPRSRLTRLVVAFYEGMTIEQIQEEARLPTAPPAQDLIEDRPTRRWEAKIDFLNYPSVADLAITKDRDDKPFTGFEPGGEGVWLAALMCDECQNPAPAILAVLQPATSGG